MRYEAIDIITFTDKNGDSYPVREMRELATFENAITIVNQQGIEIDELISRREFFGDDFEDSTFAIVDHNAEKIVENNFNLDKLKEIKIPLLEQSF